MTKKRKICVVTGTRAEYGLLQWTMQAIKQSPRFDLQVIVTGMHLSPEFGNTYKIIEQDGFKINYKVDMKLHSDSEEAVTKSIGLGTIGFADAFNKLKPDLVLLLGDRFELLGAAIAATIYKIPIAHCHGGESTEGLIDEPIRHSLTKMSHLHFVSNKLARERVIQLGENPKNVYLSGAFGIEGIKKLQLLDLAGLRKKIGLKLSKKIILVTFHPVTLEKQSARTQFKSLLAALNKLKDCEIIFTKANADTDGRIINKLIDQYTVKNKSKARAFKSLGQLLYLSVLKQADLVIGNSSSGLLEAPSFKTATINIGDRQKGRVRARSVIDCKPATKDIEKAIKAAFSSRFQKIVRESVNPYDNGIASKKVIKTLSQIDFKDLLKKTFYRL